MMVTALDHTLSGYDLSIDVGRSAANKVLAAIERTTSLWTATFAGKNETIHANGLGVFTCYELRLIRPRLKPGDEQPDLPTNGSPITSVGAWIDVAGKADSLVTVNGKEVMRYQADLSGQMSVLIEAVVKRVGRAHRLYVSFQRAKVQHVHLRNLPDDLRPLFSRAVEYIAERELRDQQQDLPISGPLGGSAIPLGLPDEVLLKSHFYRTEAGDLAIGIAGSFHPGGTSSGEKRPFDLRPQGHTDLSLTITLAYLNRLVSNIVARTRGRAWRFGGSWDKRDRSSLQIRSILLEGSALGTIRTVVRLGDGATLFAGQAELAPHVEGDRLIIGIDNVEVDMPGARGALIKILTNVAFVLVQELAGRYGARELRRRIKLAEEYGSGIVINREIFEDMPEGLTVASTIRGVRVTPQLLSVDYDVAV